MLYLFVADNFDVATKSTYGLGLPKLSALFGLLFSENRGLLFYAPVLTYGLILFFTNKLMILKVKNYGLTGSGTTAQYVQALLTKSTCG